jgi:branched-chain amino acid transport system substrate-binding protein
MSTRIGVLLPRSTDYPAMGFDMLDGLKLSLKKLGHTDVQFVTENIGFGEDTALNYSRGEKMLLQDDVALIVAYSSVGNAQPLYDLAEISGRPLIFTDAGMSLPEAYPHPLAYHLSLQGYHACRVSGEMAGEGARKVLMATSFYDGGYRGTFGAVRGIDAKSGSVCGNYISGYKVSEFTIDSYNELLASSGAQAVMANFSTYLAELFLNALAAAGPKTVPLPFYCSAFMTEEQILSRCDFPGGTFNAVLPWHSQLGGENETFTALIQKEKNKTANIFHLLGWEAGIAANRLLSEGAVSLKGWSYESPRGTVTIHPETNHSYAPLYNASIIAGENGKCRLQPGAAIPVDAATHARWLLDLPDQVISGWKNNYFCI